MAIERYSYSKLSSFDECLMGFIFNYILHSEQEKNAFGSYGSLMHSILERWAKGELEIFQLLDEFINNYDDAVPEAFPLTRNKKSMGDEYYNDAIEFLSNFDGIGNYKIIGIEEKFDVQINDFIFNGVIDLVLKDENGEIIIWDWKSKKEFKDDDEEADYRKQLYLYCYYIKEKYGKYPQETTFFCFRKQSKYTKKFDENAYNSSIKWMFDTVAKIRSLFRCYDWFKCNSICNFRKVCQIKKEMESNKDFTKIISNLKKEDRVVTDDC